MCQDSNLFGQLMVQMGTSTEPPSLAFGRSESAKSTSASCWLLEAVPMVHQLENLKACWCFYKWLLIFLHFSSINLNQPSVTFKNGELLRRFCRSMIPGHHRTKFADVEATASSYSLEIAVGHNLCAAADSMYEMADGLEVASNGVSGWQGSDTLRMQSRHVIEGEMGEVLR